MPFYIARGIFLPSPNIIDKRLFLGLADDGDTLYVLNASRLDMRNICDWRAICLSGLGGGSEKESGFNGYIAGFLAEPGASICMRREKSTMTRGRRGGGNVRGGAIENFSGL